MKRVLDSSALLTGRPFAGELLTVPSVLDEVWRHGLTPALEAMLDTQVAVAAPGRDAVARVDAAASSTGDAHRLSPTDRDLLALALETGGALVTDDYSIQNVGRVLGIPYETVLTPGIKEEWRWTYRCKGCGKVWPEWHNECPTCGSALRTSRPRPTRGKR